MPENEVVLPEPENSASLKTKKGIRVPLYLSTEEYFRLKQQAKDAGFKMIAPYVREVVFQNTRYAKATRLLRDFIAEAIRIGGE